MLLLYLLVLPLNRGLKMSCYAICCMQVSQSVSLPVLFNFTITCGEECIQCSSSNSSNNCPLKK